MKNLHMVSACWGYVLMAVHLGFHWSMMTGMARKLFPEPSAVRKWAGRILALVIAGYGIYGEYMLLRSHFVFFDYDELLVFFYLDYMAVMGLFIFIGNRGGMESDLQRFWEDRIKGQRDRHGLRICMDSR